MRASLNPAAGSRSRCAAGWSLLQRGACHVRQHVSPAAAASPQGGAATVTAPASTEVRAEPGHASLLHQQPHQPQPHPQHVLRDIPGRFLVRSVAEQFGELRRKACREFLAGGLLYVESGSALPRNGSDVFHRHRAHSNFVYLTGCELPEYAALIDAETGHFTLLAPRLPEEAAYWVGTVPTLEQLQEAYGADRVCYTDELKSLLASRPPADIHTLPGSEDKVRAAAPTGVRVTTEMLPATLDRCRARKSDAEVACLLTANAISGAAHTDMWRACRPGLYEYQLDAVFACSSRARGCPAPGYPIIVGSGPNAAVMHYEAADGLVEAGHLVLVDAGAEWRCYTADISRTFPASGSFQGAARDLYGTVLAAQEAALGVLAAGSLGGTAQASLQDADRAARLVLLEGLRDMGLIRPPTATTANAGGGGSWLEAALEAKVDRTFMPHGVGHHLGLDVHDVSEAGPVPRGALLPGHVVTVEPGAYLIPPLLAKAKSDPKLSPWIDFDRAEALARGGLGGVRIEDNVLVLAAPLAAGGGGGAAFRGARGLIYNLTEAAGVPKAMGEVEEVMRQEWKWGAW